MGSGSAPVPQLLDWNGDSKLDIVLIQPQSAMVYTSSYLPGQGNGLFGPPIPAASIPVPAGTTSVSVTELNGDGVADLLIFSSNAQPVVLFGFQQGFSSGGSLAPVSLAPNSGTGSSATFALNFSTGVTNGLPAPALAHGYVLMNDQVSASQGCLVEFTPGSNGLRLLSDDGQTWMGPVTAGSLSELRNSSCVLLGSSSHIDSAAVALNAAQYAATVGIQFLSPFAGTKQVYLLSIGSDGTNSGWVQKGTWTVQPDSVQPPAPAVGDPAAVSLAPLNGSGSSGVFTSVFGHTGGANQHYLGYTLFLPTPNVVNYTATGSCLVEYNRISKGMRLIDNAGTGWLGPVQGIAVGTPGATLSNNQCTINVQHATGTANGTTMTVTIPVTFNQALGPVLGTFLQAFDVNGKYTGMTQFGNWTLPGAPQTRIGPAVTSFSSGSAAGSSFNFSAAVSHSLGAQALAQVHIRISSAVVDQPACHLVYFPGSKTLNLINDAGTAPIAPNAVPAGSGAPLSTSVCTINPSGASGSSAATSVALSIPVTFNPATFAGARSVYVNASDSHGLLTHWVQEGFLTVQ